MNAVHHASEYRAGFGSSTASSLLTCDAPSGAVIIGGYDGIVRDDLNSSPAPGSKGVYIAGENGAESSLYFAFVYPDRE